METRKTEKLRIAYLTTEYPSVSHTFIRREIRGIESLGVFVLRSALRPSGSKLVEPLDVEESKITEYCLQHSFFFHVFTFIIHFITRPSRFFKALFVSMSMAKKSNKGILKHLAYFIEASSLLWLYKKHHIQHVHVHFGTNVTAVARILFHFGGPTYSFTVHGPDEFDAAAVLDLNGKIHDALFVVAISYYCSAQLKRWANFSDWDKIKIVHCSVGDDFFSEFSMLTAKDSPTFVCIGRLSPQKGQMILLDAFSTFLKTGRDAQLILVGDGELRSSIEERIKKENIKNKVMITGYVSEKDVRQYLKSSICLVMPSFAEGLPMVIMEAYAVGRPVISTYIAAIPELVIPGESGWLVPAADVEGFTNALINAYDCEISVLNQLADTGKQMTYEKHRTETEVTLLYNFFNEYVIVNAHDNMLG